MYYLTIHNKLVQLQVQYISSQTKIPALIHNFCCTLTAGYIFADKVENEHQNFYSANLVFALYSVTAV